MAISYHGYVPCPPPPLHTKVGSGRKATTPIGSLRVRESKCKKQGWLASSPYGDVACVNQPFALPHNLPSHLPRNGSPPSLPPPHLPCE